MDPYDVLNIDKSATQDEIKKQYRRLSMKHHPDRNGNSVESNALFQKITQAYSMIDTPEKRAKQTNAPNISNHIPEELYNFFMQTQQNMRDEKNTPHFFNFASSDQPNHEHPPFFMSLQRPPPIIKKINISFETSYTGGQIPIEIERQVKINNIRENEKETIYVTLPKGVDNNELLVIRNKGNIVDDIKGDIKIFISITPHKHFTRSGLDLIYKHEITLKQALCGFSIQIPYINGKELKINNRSGTIIPPNYEKSIPNYGFNRDSHVGNLIVKFEIIFPDKIDDNIIKEISKLLP